MQDGRTIETAAGSVQVLQRTGDFPHELHSATSYTPPRAGSRRAHDRTEPVQGWLRCVVVVCWLLVAVLAAGRRKGKQGAPGGQPVISENCRPLESGKFYLQKCLFLSKNRLVLRYPFRGLSKAIIQ